MREVASVCQITDGHHQQQKNVHDFCPLGGHFTMTTSPNPAFVSDAKDHTLTLSMIWSILRPLSYIPR